MRRHFALASLTALVLAGCAQDTGSPACDEYYQLDDDIIAGVADQDEALARLRDAFELAQDEDQQALQRHLATLIDVLRAQRDGSTGDRTSDVREAIDAIEAICPR